MAAKILNYKRKLKEKALLLDVKVQCNRKILKYTHFKHDTILIVGEHM